MSKRKSGTAPKHRSSVKSSSKKSRKSKKRATPRSIIRASPRSAPNVHVFKRSYSYPFTVGVASAANDVFLNTDSRWQILQLHTSFKALPDYIEFKSLFSEYKITSITHRLVPYFSTNLQVSFATANTGAALNIPNYEVYCLPVNSSARQAELQNMTDANLSKYINQSQRKSCRIMPNRTQTYRTTQPKVVGYKGPLDKQGGTAVMCMQSPTYLNTDPAPLVPNGQDQTDVTHYGVTLLIRRVDGGTLGPAHADNFQAMGFRMETEVFFKCRKVQ